MAGKRETGAERGENETGGGRGQTSNRWKVQESVKPAVKVFSRPYFSVDFMSVLN